jgi:hypothetical protein
MSIHNVSRIVGQQHVSDGERVEAVRHRVEAQPSARSIRPPPAKAMSMKSTTQRLGEREEHGVGKRGQSGGNAKDASDPASSGDMNFLSKLMNGLRKMLNQAEKALQSLIGGLMERIGG